MNTHGKRSVLSDKVGITSAVLCTIHCLAIPVFFIIKGWYGDTFFGYGVPAWWESIDYIFLAISFIAVYHSAAHALSKEIKAALWLCWCILTVAILFSALHVLAYVASAGLITAHFINIRRIRKAAYSTGQK